MERLVDLHVHLDGSLSLETVKELAARQGIEIQNDDILIKKLQVSKDCRDLNEYLTKFEYPLMMLQTIDSIEYAVYSLMKRQSEQNLLYSEIRFAASVFTPCTSASHKKRTFTGRSCNSCPERKTKIF